MRHILSNRLQVGEEHEGYSGIPGIVCISPSASTRAQAFFERFVPRLAKNPRVTECNPVPEAFTPVYDRLLI